MKKFPSIIARAAVATGLALGTFALVAVADFVGPPAGGPPGCPADHVGCNPPLHEGTGSQTKQGGLWLKGLKTGTELMTYGLVVENLPLLAQSGLIIPTC